MIWPSRKGRSSTQPAFTNFGDRALMRIDAVPSRCNQATDWAWNMYNGITVAMMFAVGLMSTTANTQVPTEAPTYHPTQAMQLELGKPFHARSPWRLVVTEAAPTKDYGDNEAPGALTLCLYRDPKGPCLSDLVTPPLRATTRNEANAWEPHYLLTARAVYPRGINAAPFLLIVTGSLNSGDGDQVVATQLLSYDVGRDVFRRIYSKSTGHNNNQEIRFIAEGPLRGSVITAEPQEHSPFGYWITVDRLLPEDTYRRVLRYRSATLYADGNPLAVIDSEMPNIQRRLGLWKPGDPLPTPVGDSKQCNKPTLKHSELWCE